MARLLHRRSRINGNTATLYPIPASLFSIILGLVGWGNCWRLAIRIWRLPAWISESIRLIAIAVWFRLLLLYISKWLWLRKDALAEFEHPILYCFTRLVPISTELIALAIAPYSHAVAVTLVVVGAIGQLGFGVYRSGQIWIGERHLETITPVLYLPSLLSCTTYIG